MYIYETKKLNKVYNNISFDIIVKFEEEFIPINELGEFSSNEIKGILDKIDRGIYVYFCAHVISEFNGIHLSDEYLGSCLYDSYDDFINEDNGYFSDMVNNVVSDGYIRLKQIKDELNTIV